MKDNRFIELLNLYVDRQISPAETAELEAEIQSSPRRQKVYREYCQMHRATKLVYESFRHHAGENESAQLAKGGAAITRIEHGQRHRQSRWAYYAGGLAAAACLTFVVARVNFSPNAEIAAATETVPAMQVTSAPVAPQSAAVATETRGGLVSLRNALADETDYPALLAALRQQERALAASQFSTGRLQPLFDDGVFDNRQVLPQGSQRVFRGRGATNQQPAAEFTAFQFQR